MITYVWITKNINRWGSKHTFTSTSKRKAKYYPIGILTKKYWLCIFLITLIKIYYTLADPVPTWDTGKESTCQYERGKRRGFDPWVGKIPWKKKWPPAPVFLSGKFHGQRSLVSYSPWGPKESDTTEHAGKHSLDTSYWVILCV